MVEDIFSSFVKSLKTVMTPANEVSVGLLSFILTICILNKEQKQYINNCIFKIMEEEENWIDEDPQRTEEQNIKVVKILEEAKEEKGNIFFKKL